MVRETHEKKSSDILKKVRNMPNLAVKIHIVEGHIVVNLQIIEIGI